jgi:hypothetical protein
MKYLLYAPCQELVEFIDNPASYSERELNALSTVESLLGLCQTPNVRDIAILSYIGLWEA